MTTGIPPLREWQKIARNKVLQVWQTSASTKAMIAACPGAGKTFFTTSLIREALKNGWINLAIILVPTINIQLLWVEAFKDIGIKATAEASNVNLRWRKEEGVSMVEDNQALVLTYAQLARDSELISEVARRVGKTLVVGDEIHHADDEEKYGQAVGQLAEVCVSSLALSGTPFNSEGGALALCDSEEDIDPENGKPIRRTIATHTFTYGDAILEGACRPVEFIKVCGRGEATYRLLSSEGVLKRIIDLARERKSDKISTLLDANGEFMEECARQAVRALVRMRKAGDGRAAMLVVAKNKTHGSQMANLLMRTCEAEGQRFLVQEIYNDTPKAHKRIGDLVTDTTDIVVSVRMISEGVDIKRLRVGLFATDWMTAMFFIQFIGRFARYEDRLDKIQFACVVVPAHIRLLNYCREIEKMIESAAIIQDGNGNGDKKEKKTEFVGTSTEAGEVGVIFRAQDSGKIHLAESLRRVAPSAIELPLHTQIRLAEELGLEGASPDKPQKQGKDWSKLNDEMIRAVVKRMKGNGKSDEDLYAMVQARANQAAGISRKDPMTPEATLVRRHAFLQKWLKQLIFGNGDEDVA